MTQFFSMIGNFPFDHVQQCQEDRLTQNQRQKASRLTHGNPSLCQLSGRGVYNGNFMMGATQTR